MVFPPSSCRPVCLFSRTFLVLASLVGHFGCVLSFQGFVVGRNAAPSLQFGFFDHDSEISIHFVGMDWVSESAMKENACFSFWLLAACFAAMLGLVWCGFTLVVSCPRFGFQPIQVCCDVVWCVSFSPDDAYDSAWDSVMPTKGNTLSSTSSFKRSLGVYAC